MLGRDSVNLRGMNGGLRERGVGKDEVKFEEQKGRFGKFEGVRDEKKRVNDGGGVGEQDEKGMK